MSYDMLNTFLNSTPYDILVQNERGVTLFGYPFFSTSFLLPGVDPPSYQLSLFDKSTIHTKRSLVPLRNSSSLHSVTELYPVTTPLDAKEKWYVSMDWSGEIKSGTGLADVDDQGWTYAWSFIADRWKSSKGLVRRRIWVKLPETDL
ncbi:hypothetical protein TBLA_0D04300 [Henningerozyma blattae CBS 6284]|uniref:Peroxin/Ferlin domain-containing protein n=1 Tax=Henningerozyma blattae (strain ATCC 34711 / CBS 6284 / DSM 70876 / NBRC 10599 / NRRL Y-10934 / UCD 77-7) TaxID=1071380 RepID=I2H3H4_HENB6|nr:hypothetical protein TBLA_0D04300 [Tetrapisispora blattae CBS 6284]CCH60926.1 hypothetical protein TBLA_0D04300 [Tetrapisispora blattae CBS 6284]